MTDLAAAWAIHPILTATVRGLPVPQGSIRSFGKGRPSIHSNQDRLLPWREQVQRALEDKRPDSGPISGPVAIALVFTMPKPKSAPKRKRTWPISRPDLDKLERAILDAATNSSVIVDDSQVVRLSADKTFPLEHPAALDGPGVVIAIAQVLDSYAAAIDAAVTMAAERDADLDEDQPRARPLTTDELDSLSTRLGMPLAGSILDIALPADDFDGVPW